MSLIHVPLSLHPSLPQGEAGPVTVEIDADRDRVRLTYSVGGKVADLLIPPPGLGGAEDGLWKHTCFELFLRAPGGKRYAEFNFSPSGAWAAYKFADVRTGMTPFNVSPEISFQGNKLTVVLKTAGLPVFLSGPMVANVAAVLETKSGVLSYWAAAHPSPQPDFHHPAAFVVGVNS